jgi:uncharacterized protein (DUF2235 family)
MPKNIVICCDGTNNQFGSCNTNVVRMVQILVQDASRQVCYYDPGVGTLPDQGWRTRLGRYFAKLTALMFATDLHDKVSIAYAHLMDVWEPEDRVFIFGFSRGAYTARVLAALLHSVGLMPRGNSQLLPYALQLFSSLRHDSPREYWSLLNSFRNSFARPIPGRLDSHFPVHFLGLWDTVSSAGWIWDPPSYPYTAKLSNVAVVRHAVSIDERRWFFRQNRILVQAGQDAREVWFAGVHSDVGGGYPEKLGGLWRVTFEWMVREATATGLLVDEVRLQRVRSRSEEPERPWAEPQNESLKGAWWLGEVVPKLVYDSATKKRRPKLGLGGHREPHNGETIDGSVLHRLRDTAYTPPGLSARFVAEAKALEVVPESYPYSGR